MSDDDSAVPVTIEQLSEGGWLLTAEADYSDGLVLSEAPGVDADLHVNSIGMEFHGFLANGAPATYRVLMPTAEIPEMIHHLVTLLVLGHDEATKQ